MKFSIDVGRWTTARAALAIAGVLAISGAVGSALAISPIVAPSIKWAGGAEFVYPNMGGGPIGLYTVPAGRNLILTDLAFANVQASTSAATVSTGTPGCRGGRTRMYFSVPPGTTSVALQTGIGFAAGEQVCIEAQTVLAVSGRGFLFIPE